MITIQSTRKDDILIFEFPWGCYLLSRLIFPINTYHERVILFQNDLAILQTSCAPTCDFGIKVPIFANGKGAAQLKICTTKDIPSIDCEIAFISDYGDLRQDLGLHEPRIPIIEGSIINIPLHMIRLGNGTVRRQFLQVLWPGSCLRYNERLRLTDKLL